MMPLVRWTIGPVHDLGFSVLRHSVNQMRRIYGDMMRYVICYNGLSDGQLCKIRDLGCRCVDQQQHELALLIPPPCKEGGPAWKLYPPRLSPESHEIFIDNDLVLRSRLAALDQFIGDQKGIIVTRAVRRCYGVFEPFVRDELLINTGLVGLPPNFDWADNLNYYIKSSGIHRWNGHFDEQGLVAAVVQSHPVNIIDGISVCWSEREYKPSNLGMHFVGVNQGDAAYWLRYCQERMGA